ncbi:MAG: GreA/GreB family elongation factor [Alphaproteobacteria bacterium]|nr:GreA/GreB family elongation factor [Alphaproteobacteria bacterium]
MSRGFVKEGDQEEVPMVPPRADLPPGVTNYVTPEGMDLLLSERESLISQREQVDRTLENERRIAVNLINAKLLLLEQRISGARVINPDEQPQDEVRFGATVTLRIEATGKVQDFRIVGVDEADISKGKISFLSPLAKALIHKKAGDRVVIGMGRFERSFTIIKIAYQRPV